MTNGCAVERARSPKTATCPSSAVVTQSVTPAVVSVFWCTRPSPGKCLSVAVTSARARPSITVPTAVPTLSGLLPYWRSKAPTGVLPASVPAGTTSATGARARFRRASRSAVPMPWARAARSAGDSALWCSAEGSRSNPGPLSDWTAPPSWSAASQRSGYGARDCHRWAVAASSATGASDRPARKRPPRPLGASASPAPRSSSGTPARNSWLICARRSSRDRAMATRSSGPEGALLGSPVGAVLLGVVVVAVVVSAAGAAPPADEQAVSSAVSAHRSAAPRPRRPAVGMDLLGGVAAVAGPVSLAVRSPSGRAGARAACVAPSPLVSAQRVVLGHLDEDDRHAVRILDPCLDEAPRLLLWRPGDRHPGRH